MIVILGAGLAGLSAGYELSHSGREITIIERDSSVGGLAKTITHNGFRFDLGGHRFITRDEEVKSLIKEILKDEFLIVHRKSQIFMLDKYFDYPLKPSNAVFGIGLFTTLKIISDYCKERMADTFSSKEVVSLKDWVVRKFGRKMFNLYFKQYSEKVWGMDCSCISKEWVALRIEGLSLWKAIKNAFFKFSGKDIDTLTDSFIYPLLGIGQISEGLKGRITQENHIFTNSKVIKLEHEDFYIKNVIVEDENDIYEIEGSEFVSSIPLTNLLQMFYPQPPVDILEAVSKLHYRDLVIVSLLLDRERVTDLTWLYIPEKRIPIGRIHEPKNWSPFMAPQGKTHIVAEYFCFKGDRIWSSTDERLTSVTVEHLSNLSFFCRSELIDSCVVRVPKAYPLLDVEYRRHYLKILGYLKQFKNLHIGGRGGMFRYLNMDHAIASGIEVAKKILSNHHAPWFTKAKQRCHPELVSGSYEMPKQVRHDTFVSSLK
jgi:protoporphyrinogen oxidase